MSFLRVFLIHSYTPLPILFSYPKQGIDKLKGLAYTLLMPCVELLDDSLCTI